MAIKTIEIKECDLCYQEIEGHYYIYKFETGEFDICRDCANKHLSPAIQFLNGVAKLNIEARADSKIWDR